MFQTTARNNLFANVWKTQGQTFECLFCYQSVLNWHLYPTTLCYQFDRDKKLKKNKRVLFGHFCCRHGWRFASLMWGSSAQILNCLMKILGLNGTIPYSPPPTEALLLLGDMSIRGSEWEKKWMATHVWRNGNGWWDWMVGFFWTLKCCAICQFDTKEQRIP